MSETLRPTFSYAIFGDAEKIFGYKNLSIDVYIAADSLLTLLEISYSEKISASLGVEAEDLAAIISEYLPEDTFKNRVEWERACQAVSSDFQPFGTQLAQYSSNSTVYKIYRASPSDTAFVAQLERMQIFSILYIEGASLIDATDDRFDVYTIYSEHVGSYAFIGYCTCYRYFFYDRPNHSFEYIRYRISQFLVLPQHQSAGHGGHMYDTIIQTCQAEDRVLEVTVEDPSEAFDDLRDRRDLLRLKQEDRLPNSKLTLPLDEQWFATQQRSCKIAPRQFTRLIEINLLAAAQSKSSETIYRKFVKKRLYKKNKDILAELTPSERVEKLEETYQTQIEDYKRLIDSLQVTIDNGNPNGDGIKRSQERVMLSDDIVQTKKQRQS